MLFRLQRSLKTSKMCEANNYSDKRSFKLWFLHDFTALISVIAVFVSYEVGVEVLVLANIVSYLMFSSARSRAIKIRFRFCTMALKMKLLVYLILHLHQKKLTLCHLGGGGQIPGRLSLITPKLQKISK